MGWQGVIKHLTCEVDSGSDTRVCAQSFLLCWRLVVLFLSGGTFSTNLTFSCSRCEWGRWQDEGQDDDEDEEDGGGDGHKWKMSGDCICNYCIIPSQLYQFAIRTSSSPSSSPHATSSSASTWLCCWQSTGGDLIEERNKDTTTDFDWYEVLRFQPGFEHGQDL